MVGGGIIAALGTALWGALGWWQEIKHPPRHRMTPEREKSLHELLERGRAPSVTRQMFRHWKGKNAQRP